jgi:hypothetical protein
MHLFDQIERPSQRMAYICASDLRAAGGVIQSRLR